MAMIRFIPFVAIVLLAPALDAGKRRAPSLIGFHLEASEGDRPKKTTRVVLGVQSYNVRLEPAFEQDDIVGFYPFEADDGRTYGSAFKLNDRAARKLASLTSDANGKRIFTVVGTDAIGAVLIDRPVEDGYIVCWKGLRTEHVKAFEGVFPKIEAVPSPTGSADDFIDRRAR